MKYTAIQRSGAPSSDLPKKSKSLSRLILIVYGFVGILAIVNLVGTNSLATQGVVLDTVLRETEMRTKENQILAVEIGKVSALSYIESSVVKLGFSRVTSNLIVSPVEAVAALIQR